MPYHCCWGECRSDSRYPQEGVTFISFPKPKTFPDKAKRWAFLCGRGKEFTVDKITRNTKICSKHFPELIWQLVLWFWKLFWRVDLGDAVEIAQLQMD